MRSRRALLIVLDGYDAALGERLAAQGEMPALACLLERGARFELEHGNARWTGLAGEHLSTGLSPEAAGRFSSVHFDRERYTVHYEKARLPPFPAGVPVRTVVFNPTYFDLARTPGVQGLVGCGGVHDPGVSPFARPAELAAEIGARFGADPGVDWTYGIVWPSPARTRAMARALAESLALKARIAHWLLTERLPDWDLAIVGVGEVHSILEAMWHGIDPAHPLHGAASAAPAGEGARAIYRAADGLIESLARALPGTAIVVTSLHGMGPNVSDIAGTALLPELMFRHERGARLMDAASGRSAMPALAEDGDWYGAMRRSFGARATRIGRWRRIAASLGWRGAGAHELPGDEILSGDPALDWMPATWYHRHWKNMRAFALPGYYNGRIRINLAGRERNGMVALGEYRAECERIERLIGACRDVSTGAPVVGDFECAAPGTAMRLDPTAADIVVRWDGSPTGFVHPALGRIGPFPYRRMGGHTGGHGAAYIAGPGVGAGARGLRSAFDVVPTVLDLLGVAKPPHLSGTSLLGAAS